MGGYFIKILLSNGLEFEYDVIVTSYSELFEYINSKIEIIIGKNKDFFQVSNILIKSDKQALKELYEV